MEHAQEGVYALSTPQGFRDLGRVRSALYQACRQCSVYTVLAPSTLRLMLWSLHRYAIGKTVVTYHKARTISHVSFRAPWLAI